MTKISTLAFVLATCGAACAQENPFAKIGLVGIGSTNCSQIVTHDRKKRPEKDPTMYLTWAQGFMSGLNRGYDWLHKPARDIMAWSIQAQSAHLIEFCSKNPSKLFVTAVFDPFYALPEVIDVDATGYLVSD